MLTYVQRTSTRVPRLPEPIVQRTHLDLLLEEGVRRPLTVVSAPPGAGKTTLLAGWVHRATDRPVAWLALERADNQPGRFARSVLDTLNDFGMVSTRRGSENLDATRPLARLLSGE